MLDELFFKAGFEKKRMNFVFFGFVITFIGFLTSLLLFKGDSLATLLIITILLMPVLMRLFLKEERIGRARKKLKNIFKNHRSVFETYFFLFLGIFFAFLILQLTTIYNQDFFANTFEFQSNWVINNQESFGIIQDDIGGVIISSFVIESGSKIDDFIFLAIILKESISSSCPS